MPKACLNRIHKYRMTIGIAISHKCHRSFLLILISFMNKHYCRTKVGNLFRLVIYKTGKLILRTFVLMIEHLSKKICGHFLLIKPNLHISGSSKAPKTGGESITKSDKLIG